MSSAMLICLVYAAGAIYTTGFGQRFDELAKIYKGAEPSDQLLAAKSYELRTAKNLFTSADNFNVLQKGLLRAALHVQGPKAVDHCGPVLQDGLLE